MDPAGRQARLVAFVLLTALLGTAACSPTDLARTPGPSGSSGPSVVAVGPSPSAEASTPAATDAATAAPAVPGPPIGTTGSVAVLGADLSLSLVDAAGTTFVLASADAGMFAFPAWSPDGSRIAAIRYDTTGAATILVFDGQEAASGEPVQPVEILRSAAFTPFYLSWTPDGWFVSFLADEGGGLSLRVAPADGSAPLDGSGPGAKIGQGNPFYYDWIAPDQLLAHVGSGPGALVGEIGIDGVATAPVRESPGAFRSAVVSSDRRFMSYARMGDGGASEVVVAARDGTSEQTMPVFGFAAMAFDPTGDTVASIGAIEPAATPLEIPVGPLRLLDPETGDDRTLLDGTVVSFWWSPDGTTIAALRAQPIENATSSSAPASASALPSPDAPANEIRLLFVDVASGEIRSQAVVAPGQLFIDQLLTYFDQYALSHRLWAPDSSSFLLPVIEADGRTRVAVMSRDGDEPVLLDGQAGFWSP